ncbi:Tautomerase/MIF superfamily [Glomus cerebriforme]|uniref:L-dopachrome isomerase n=1 Tax=Glomus cerebriforme TaxID=658196 RepID=A0A397TDS4_9GLOM|nr:Tautomerase/MIF superfamily [Glomus cerebriforme]
MPYIEIKTNVQVKNHQEFIRALSTYSSNALGKPALYICVSLQDNLSMIFNDSDEPAFIANITSLGIDSPTIKKMIKELSEFFEKELKASSDRGYIIFRDPGRANTGWGGSTFE